MVLCSVAQNGSIPTPIPVMELKLLCPPPGKSCYYCVFHNLISFFSFAFYFFFIKENIFVFEAIARAGRERARENKYIFFYCSVVRIAIYVFETIAGTEWKRVRENIYSFSNMFFLCFFIINYST